jgi:DNA replication protein DnaD
MERLLYHFTTKELQNKSHSSLQFQRGLKKAFNRLLPHEIDKLLKWLESFLKQKPDLKEVTLAVLKSKK